MPTPRDTAVGAVSAAVDIIEALFHVIVRGPDGSGPLDSDPCSTVDGYLSPEQALDYHQLKSLVLASSLRPDPLEAKLDPTYWHPGDVVVRVAPAGQVYIGVLSNRGEGFWSLSGGSGHLSDADADDWMHLPKAAVVAAAARAYRPVGAPLTDAELAAEQDAQRTL